MILMSSPPPTPTRCYSIKAEKAYYSIFTAYNRIFQEFDSSWEKLGNLIIQDSTIRFITTFSFLRNLLEAHSLYLVVFGLRKRWLKYNRQYIWKPSEQITKCKYLSPSFLCQYVFPGAENSTQWCGPYLNKKVCTWEYSRCF
jgi:hypothetical protein